MVEAVVSRRDFLMFGGMALLSPGLAFSGTKSIDGVEAFDEVSAAPPPKTVLNSDRRVYQTSHPRTLWIRRGKDEFLLDVYTKEGYSRLAWLARDIRAGDIVGTPDPRLVRQSVWVQDRLARHGYRRPLVMTSGLRMPHTNSTTEGAARASFHLPDENMKFKAFDFEVPGVPSSVLASVALSARDGGVGFYGDKGHVHIDSGQVRFWRGANA